MYDSKQEAWNDYETEVENVFDIEIDDTPSSDIVYNNTEPRTKYYYTNQKIMTSAIQKSIKRLKEMIQDGKNAEDPSSTIEENWESNFNDVKSDYPIWKDYIYSDDYNREYNVLSEIFWNDFNREYEDELSYFDDWRDWNQLEGQIEQIIDDIKNIPDKINKIKIDIGRLIISRCFQ